PQPRERASHRRGQSVVAPLAFDEVRDHFGVGLGAEPVPLSGQLLPQLQVVLDDSVVDDHDTAGAVAVRVGVLLRRTAVGRPARVADAELTVDRLAAQHFLELRQLAGAAADVHGAVAYDRDAGRVVAAILQPPQALDEDGNERLVTQVSDDAAHESARLVLVFQAAGAAFGPAVLVDLVRARHRQ